MAKWSEKELKSQFDRAKALHWLDIFEVVSDHTNWSPGFILALGSRETNLRNIVGDNGHGYGVLQVDIRTDPNFCKSGQWKDVHESLRRGVEILNGKMNWLQINAGKNVIVKDSRGQSVKFLVPREVIDTTVLSNIDSTLSVPLPARLATAMYNGGAWPVYHYSKGRDPDYTTTGKDYSADVFRRAIYFQKFLDQEKATK